MNCPVSLGDGACSDNIVAALHKRKQTNKQSLFVLSFSLSLSLLSLKHSFCLLFQMFHDVSVLFSDVVGFTHICSLISPMGVVTMLNNMYTAFDQISEQHNVYKVSSVNSMFLST